MLDVTQYYFRSKPVLAALSKTEARRLKSYLTTKKLRKGRMLFREGSFPRSAYILKSGKVKLFQQTPDGTDKLIYLYTQGEMFGYRPLVCEDRHPASAMAVEDCVLYVLAARNFLSFLRHSTQLSNILLRNLTHEFSVLVNRIGVFSQTSVKERTALSLLIFNEKYKRPGVKETEITLSRHDLAAYVGTTIETIARIITQFREYQLIKTRGRKIIIANYKGLVKMVE